MIIGIDVMGGDFAPDAIVKGAISSLEFLSENEKLALIGDEKSILSICKECNVDPAAFIIVPTTEIIEMGEHPAKAFSNKRNSSVVVGFNMLLKGEIDAFTSAGNTGAVLVGAMYTIKSIPGIIRPCITVPIPKLHGGRTVLLDVGINPDCRPDVLFQYGILGSIYSANVHGVTNPRVGLLNIGEEEEKGNLQTKATFELMKGTTQFNFIGNVEGKDLYNDKADVIVCDGFIGNVVLKQAESIYEIAKARNISDEYFENFNFETYGGTPILGINGTVTIGHGASNAVAVRNMILHTRDVSLAKLSEKIKDAFI